MRKIYCNECYKYTSTTPKEKKHPRGIQEIYFKCDHCYFRYTVAVSNNRTRKLQRTMKRKGIRYVGEEYQSLDTKTGKEITVKRSPEQVELDETMDRLKHNLIQYGVADL